MYVTAVVVSSVVISLQPNPFGIGKGRTGRFVTFGHP